MNFRQEFPLFQSRRAIEKWATATSVAVEGIETRASLPLEIQPYPMQRQEHQVTDSPLQNASRANDLCLDSALPCIKIVVLGAHSVGKTSLISRFLERDEEFKADDEEQDWQHSPSASSASTLLPLPPSTSASVHINSRVADQSPPTIPSLINTTAVVAATRNYYKTIIQVRPGISVNAHILDDQREETDEINALSSATIFPSTTRGAMVVYDVGDRASFENLTSIISEYRKLCPLGMQAGILIVGNKSDLPSHRRQVSRKQGQDLALRLGCMFYECCSLSYNEACNVDLAFISLFSSLYNGLPQRLSRSPHVTVEIDDDDDEFDDADLEDFIPCDHKTSNMEIVVNQLEALDVSESLQGKKRNASSSLARESFFDKTLDLLDWLIPSSPSDNEFSDEEALFDVNSKRAVINPGDTVSTIMNLRHQKRKRVKFSNRQLVDSLQPFPPPRTTSLQASIPPTMIPSIQPFSFEQALDSHDTYSHSPFFAFSKDDLGINPITDDHLGFI